MKIFVTHFVAIKQDKLKFFCSKRCGSKFKYVKRGENNDGKIWVRKIYGSQGSPVGCTITTITHEWNEKFVGGKTRRGKYREEQRAKCSIDIHTQKDFHFLLFNGCE